MTNNVLYNIQRLLTKSTFSTHFKHEDGYLYELKWQEWQAFPASVQLIGNFGLINQ